MGSNTKIVTKRDRALILEAKILIVAEVIRRLATDTLEKPELRYGHLVAFWRLNW